MLIIDFALAGLGVAWAAQIVLASATIGFVAIRGQKRPVEVTENA
jgi:hypothetical protein